MLGLGRRILRDGYRHFSSLPLRKASVVFLSLNRGYKFNCLPRHQFTRYVSQTSKKHALPDASAYSAPRKHPGPKPSKKEPPKSLRAFAREGPQIQQSSKNDLNSTRARALRLLSFAVFNILPWVPILFVIDRHVLSIVDVTGPSMAPLFNGDHQPDRPNTRDRVLVNMLYPQDKIQRGTVVAYRTPHDPNKIAIKRVVGLPGDVVQPRTKDYDGGQEEVLVPHYHLWVEGDNVDNSKTLDSNRFGPISQGLVLGKAVAVLWPFRHIQTVSWKTWEGCDRVTEDAMKLPDEDGEADKAIWKRIQQSRQDEEAQSTLLSDVAVK